MRRMLCIGCLVFLVGCATTNTPTTQPVESTPTTEATSQPDQTNQATQQSERITTLLAQHTSLPESDIEIISLTEKQWSSTALGCPAANMRYVQKITPGFEIIAQQGATTYTVHTDQSDKAILCENGKPIDLVTTQSSTEPSKENPIMKTTQEVIDTHAQTFGLDKAQVTLLSEEEVMWSSSALGCPKKGNMYLTVLTPGWRIMLEHDGVQYAYHAGENRNFFLCEFPQNPIGE